jgi:signal peptidase I
VETPASVRSRSRTVVERCVWLLLAALTLENWLLAGLAVPCRVVGDSMAETLLGAHREVVCGDCGHRFTCGVDPKCIRTKAVCPNCGYADNDLASLPALRGERLLIDRMIFSLRPPRRWEVATLRHPQRSNDVLVKRIVGLPGESIEIRDGDVFANGQIQRKNLAQQHALAVLVHDADCRPTRKPAAHSRWRAENASSRWTAAGTGFSHPGGLSEMLIDWLAYHHERRTADGKTVEEPVNDLCGYNQSQPRRDEDVHAVADLLLSFQLETTGDGTLFVRAVDGRDTFEVRLRCLKSDSSQWKCEAFRNGSFIGEKGGSARRANRQVVEVSLIDRQLMLALDGRTVLAWAYERRGPASSASPFAIGVQGLGATVRRLRVFRDVYYTQPMPARMNQTAAAYVSLGGEEYFVLGDNSPISDDSRTWPAGAAITSKSLTGKPLAAIPSLEVTPWEGWHFQVPNLRRIRYIQ